MQVALILLSHSSMLDILCHQLVQDFRSSAGSHYIVQGNLNLRSLETKVTNMYYRAQLKIILFLKDTVSVSGSLANLEDYSEVYMQ